MYGITAMGDENAQSFLQNLMGEIPSGDMGTYMRKLLKWI
jgi:hypothetical protein